jgi:hypothetical protein
VVIDRLLADLGTSVFSGRLEHQGDRKSPWAFDLRADNLSLEQGATWFVALGAHKPISLLQQIPGLRPSDAARQAASNLFTSLNARGNFATSKVTYRDITLSNFRTEVEVVGRAVRVDDATFRAGGGQGRLTGRMDLSGTPARLTGDFSLSGVGIQSLVTHLPPALRGAHGSMSLQAHVETTGLGQDEMRRNLDGHAAVITSDLSLMGFDPVAEFVRLSGEGDLEPLRGPSLFRPLRLNVQVHDGRVVLKKTALESSGARLSFSGSYAFDGSAALHVAADLRHLRRRWLTRLDEADRDPSPRELNFSGPLDKLALISDTEVSHARP